MNAKRRSVLNTQKELLIKIKHIIEEVKDEEEFAYDNYPDNLKESEKGVEMDENISTLDTIIDDIDSIIDEFDEII